MVQNDQPMVLEFPTKKMAGLVASKTGKFTKGELFERFEKGSRGEKMQALRDIAGKSQSVIAPTDGARYVPGLNEDPEVRNILFDQSDLGVTVYAHEDLDNHVLIIDDQESVINIREVDSKTYENVEERNGTSAFGGMDNLFANTERDHSASFGDGITLSEMRNNVVVFTDSGNEVNGTDYFSVKFDVLENMVRIGREGGYRKSYLSGKKIHWDDDQELAVVRTEDDGVYLLAGFVDETNGQKTSLIGIAQQNKNGTVGRNGLDVLYKGYFDNQEEIFERYNELLDSGQISMSNNQAISKLKNEDLDVGDISVDLDREIVNDILDLDPEPVIVTDTLVETLRDQYPNPEYKYYYAYKDYDEFTGQDGKEYDIDAGDIVEVPEADADGLSPTYRSGDLKEIEEFFDVLNEYPSEKLGSKSWSIETDAGEINVQFTMDIDSVRPKPIHIGGDIVKEFNEETSYPLTSIGRDGDSLRVRPGYVRKAIEELEEYAEKEEEEMAELNDVLANPEISDDMVQQAHDVSVKNWGMIDPGKPVGDGERIAQWVRNDGDMRVQIETLTRPKSSRAKDGREQVFKTIIHKEAPGDISERTYDRFSGALRRATKFMKANNTLGMSDQDVEYSVKKTQGRLADGETDKSASEILEKSFGNVTTEVVIDHDETKEISSMRQAKSHFLDMDIENKPDERFMVVYLAGDNEVLGTQIVAMGGNGEVNFDYQEVIRTGAMINARAVIVAHNHPSGNSEPSDQDITTTREMKRTLGDSGFDLLDHIIVASDGATSMKATTSAL